jgi:hypothetical protein
LESESGTSKEHKHSREAETKQPYANSEHNKETDTAIAIEAEAAFLFGG